MEYIKEIHQDIEEKGRGYLYGMMEKFILV